MSYFKSIVRAIWKNVSAEDPYTVKRVSSQVFLTANLVCRADFLLLYERVLQTGTVFEVIVCEHVNQSPDAVFSLLQTPEETEAQGFFCSLNDVLTPLVKCYSYLLKSKELLQKLCASIRDNPAWSAAHVAASLGWADCFKHDEIIQQKDNVCPITQVTPLHLAVAGSWPAVIEHLLNLEANMSAKVLNGNNAFHCATGCSKSIMQALCSRATIVTVNERNNAGYTPLQLTCLAENPNCFKELLCSGADVNLIEGHDGVPQQRPLLSSDRIKEILNKYPNLLKSKDFASGGTLLHWAETPECIEALIEWGCSLDARNFNGDTALHLMVKRNRLPCLLTLLFNNANPNIPNSEGDSPLQLAASSGNQEMTLALVVFGADVNWLNGYGDSARHMAGISTAAESDHILYILHSVGAKRCTEPREDCNIGCSFCGEYNGIVPVESQMKIPDICNDIFGLDITTSGQRKRSHSGGEPSGRKRLRRGGGGRVLCLDGGGIRGLVMIQTLTVLEEILGAPVMHFFDWIAGTSSGAILGLALSMGRSLNECRRLYFKMKDKVFVGMRPYSSEPFDEMLQQEFGLQTLMTDIKNIKVMVTSYLADGQSAQLHLFRNYDSPQKILAQLLNNSGPPSTQEPQEEQLVWKAARASSAAPSYFKPLDKFLDGGLIANNPTVDALTEIHQYNLALRATGRVERCEELSVVVSIGCGMFPSASADCINLSRPDSLWNLAKFVLEIPALLFWFVDRTTETDGRVVERAQAFCNMNGASYFRINAPLSKAVPLNEKDNSILIRALWETMSYLYSQRNQLIELKSILTNSES